MNSECINIIEFNCMSDTDDIDFNSNYDNEKGV
jgi:hypothetical protein